MRLFSDEKGNAKIQIQNVEEFDGGLYFCVAENKAGRTKTCCTLRVAGKSALHAQIRGGLDLLVPNSLSVRHIVLRCETGPRRFGLGTIYQPSYGRSN